jgi:biopolymer transport protein ExbD
LTACSSPPLPPAVPEPEPEPATVAEPEPEPEPAPEPEPEPEPEVIDVPLPRTDEAVTTRAVLVRITAAGELTVDGQATADADLAGRFSAALDENPDARVIITADPATDHGRVVQVMEAAKSAGLTRIAIAIAKK